MKSIVAAFKPITPWQATVLILALLGSGFGSYAAYGAADSASAVSLGENQDLIPVRRGNLINAVSINGSLLFPNREIVQFSVAGKVAEVLIEEGQSVVAGQELATLDALTIAKLEETVASARVALRNAQDALTTAMEPASVLDINQAKLDIAKIMLDIQKAQQALADAVGPTIALDINQAKLDIAKIMLDIQEARQALADAQVPASGQALRDREEIIAATNVKVQDAEEALAAAKLPPTAGEIDTANAAWEKARQDIASAENAVTQARNAQADLLTTTEAALDAKKFDYRRVLENIGASGVPEEDIFLDPQTLLLKFAIIESSVGSALSAWTALIAARDDFEAATAEEAVTSATRALTQTQETLASNEEALASLLLKPDPLAIALKEANLAAAREDLTQERQTLTDLLTGADALDITHKELQIKLLEGKLAAAEDDLAVLSPGANALDIADKELQIILSEAKLAAAEDALADLNAGADELDVALRQKEVATQETALATAIEDAAGSTLRAPIAGVVDTLNIEPGSPVTASTIAVEIVDTTVAEVDGSIDEIDVLFIQTGAIATVSMDALGGQTLEGIVSSIASTGNTQSGVVSFAIRVQVTAPQGVSLREGLSAVARVVIRENIDVLLVPSSAIGGNFEAPTVLVAEGSKLVERPVILGDSDDFWVEVEAGVTEGEQVVIQTTQGGTNPFAFFGGGAGAFRAFTGGGFGGGGFQPPGGGFGGGGGGGGGGQGR